MRKSVDLLSLKSFEGPSSKPYLSFEDNLSAMATPIYNTENSSAPGFFEGFVDPQFAPSCTDDMQDFDQNISNDATTENQNPIKPKGALFVQLVLDGAEVRVVNREVVPIAGKPTLCIPQLNNISSPRARSSPHNLDAKSGSPHFLQTNHFPSPRNPGCGSPHWLETNTASPRFPTSPSVLLSAVESDARRHISACRSIGSASPRSSRPANPYDAAPSPTPRLPSTSPCAELKPFEGAARACGPALFRDGSPWRRLGEDQACRLSSPLALGADPGPLLAGPPPACADRRRSSTARREGPPGWAAGEPSAPAPHFDPWVPSPPPALRPEPQMLDGSESSSRVVARAR